MTSFDDKEKAAENKYAHDQELLFRIHARAHKLIGLWAAGKMSLTAPLTQEYAKSLVAADLGRVDGHTLFERVKGDLLAHDVHMSDHAIRAELHRL